LDKVADAAQLERLLSLDKVADAAQLEDLLRLDDLTDAAQLEDLLKLDGLGPEMIKDLGPKLLDDLGPDLIKDWLDAQDRFAGRFDRWAASKLLEGGLSGTETKALLNKIAEMSTHGELTEGGIVSLGRWEAQGGFPGYIDWARTNAGAVYFDMDTQVYPMIKGAKIGDATIAWLINEQFLDNAIEAGVVFRLQPVMPPADSGFGREIAYLLERGYEIVEEGGEWLMKR
jgi:hypothetical protein